jgi:hypothetical protein
MSRSIYIAILLELLGGGCIASGGSAQTTKASDPKFGKVRIADRPSNSFSEF